MAICRYIAWVYAISEPGDLKSFVQNLGDLAVSVCTNLETSEQVPNLTTFNSAAASYEKLWLHFGGFLLSTDSR